MSSRFPTLVLDTNAFSVRGFVHWLARYPGRKVLPAFGYVELGIHFGGAQALDRLRTTLAAAGVEIEWFRVREAEAAIRSGLDVGDFAMHARDHLIAGHAQAPDRVLVTDNVRDFGHLRRVAKPIDLMS